MFPTPSSSLVYCGAVAQPPGNRPGLAHQAGEAARAMVAIQLPLCSPTGVNRKQIHAFAELEFVAKAENIVLIGSTGVGKTGPGIGSAAQSTGEWLPLSVHPCTRSVRRMLCLAGRPFLAPTAEPAGPSGRLINRRAWVFKSQNQSSPTSSSSSWRALPRHSTIITSNLAYDEWRNFLGNQAMVDALLSRLRH